MRKTLIALLALSSVSAFADCIEHNARGGNSAIYSWCTGDEVLARSKTNSSDFKKGVITKVSMKKTSDWFNSISSIKITVKLENKQTVELGSHSTFKLNGCQVYDTRHSWDSREFCDGEKVDMPTYYPNTNRPTGDAIPGKIIAIGFVQALVETPKGIVERGSFAE